MKLNLFFLSAAALVNAAIAVEKVDLKTAGNYAILAKTGISTVPDSVITGDIAVSPITAAAITGFSMTRDSKMKFSTSTQIVGKAYAANYATPTPTLLTSAVEDMETAYTDAKGRPNTVGSRKNLGGGTLGGDSGGADFPLTPDVYTFGTGVAISGDIYFEGGADDVFIIQTTGDLSQAANTNVILTGGAQVENIFWQVAGTVTVGVGAHLEGVVLVKTKAVFMTGSSLNGRVLAQTACTLDQATVTQP
jgi:hypothetical protein